MEALVALGLELVGGIVSTIKAAKEKGDAEAVAAAYAELGALLAQGALTADARVQAHRQVSDDADKALAAKFDTTDAPPVEETTKP